MKAIWNGEVLAESNETVVVEGAHYYDVCVNGETNKEAAWFYPHPKVEANQILGHVAFWKGVEVRA